MKKGWLLLLFVLVLSIISPGYFACSDGSGSKQESGLSQEGRFKMGQVRKPAVAGQFYPGDPVTLTKQLSDFFKSAKKEPVL